MAVPEQTPYIEHIGNGATTSFALKFQCESKDHLIVLIDDIEPPIATWSLTGGNVVFTTAPAAGKKITLQRNTPFNRTTDYQSYNNSFRPPAVNKDFDWIWWKLQELGVADWILGARIDALKNYVDRKDDELKAYLMEEIRKQGVALDQLDDYYNYLMRRLAQIAVDKGWEASFVVDASGKTQQEINDLRSSEGVNILSVYGGINDFGVALELAYAKAMTTDCRKIVIPDRTYSAKTTANLILSSNFTLKFSNGVVINVDNRVDVFDITQGQYTLNVMGDGTSVYPNWGTGSDPVAVFKLDSRTLSKSLVASKINIFEKNGNKFTNGINAIGLNYSTIEDCTIQAVNPLVNASALSGTSTHAMGTEVINCKLHADDTAVTLINNGDLGCEGWKFKGGEYFGKTGLKVIDNLNDSNYYPPLLLIDGVHINAQRFFSLSGISRVKVSACDLQSQVTANSEFRGLIEFDGVQVFDIDETTAISQSNTTGTAPTDSLPVYFLRNSAKGKTSAFLEFGVKNYWLQQNAPLIDFDTSVSLNGRVNFGKINTGAFTGIIVSAGNAKKVSVSAETMLNNAQVGTGFSTSTDISFNDGTGVLNINSAPSIGDIYQLPTSILPDNATINQIKVSEQAGKEFTIIVDASNVTINHSANLYTPIGVQNKLLYGSVLRVLSYNSDWCRILSVSPHASMLPASVPANTAASGIHGQRVYSGGFVYEYFQGVGWVRYTASSF